MRQDVRFCLRSLRRQPGFALAVVATLAVGIGATTAIFSAVNATVLRPLPFPHPEDLFAVYTPATDGRFTLGSLSGVEVMRLNTPAVSIVRAAGGQRIDTTILRDDGGAIPAVAWAVTEGFFDVFGAPMAAGRGFTHAEHAPGAPWEAVLSYRVWQELYGGDSAVLGKTMRLAIGPPTPTMIIGIAPREFDMPLGADFWVPAAITPQMTGHGLTSYLRIKPGTRLERLQDETAAAMSGIARDYGALGKNRRYDLQPLAAAIVGDLRATLVVVLAGAALLLVLACVNVTNLMFARGAMRAREMAVRVALGASRGRLVRQMLTESLVLSAAGTLVGCALAFAGIRLSFALGASELPRLDRIPLDARVLAFAFAAMLVTALVVGFAPAFRLAGTSVNALMNDVSRSATGGKGSARILHALIVAEIALAIVLVAGAGWMARSFANLGAADPGFSARGRLFFDIAMPAARILPPPGAEPLTFPLISGRNATWTQQVCDRIGAIAGVTSVGTAATLPLEADHDGALYIGVQGEPVDPDHPRVTRWHRVSPSFFDAMGVRLLAGRRFTADDRATTMPVAIVNRTFARRYLADKDPLTVKFTAGYPDVPAAPFVTIVGVVDDVRYVSVGQAADPAYYVPQAQSPYFAQTFIINTSVADPMAIAATVQSTMKQIDPLLPVTPRSMTDLVSRSLIRQRLGMTLMLLFASAALALAAVGIYGTIAYASTQRIGEIATRMALGATRSDVFWLLLKQGRALAIIGTVAGVAIAYAAGRAASSFLYEVRASDPVVLVSAAALVGVLTFVAILIPARRVSRVEPSQILRMG
jgi:putative ABC transport system permease protein